jgi:hypothetical protein
MCPGKNIGGVGVIFVSLGSASQIYRCRVLRTHTNPSDLFDPLHMPRHGIILICMCVVTRSWCVAALIACFERALICDCMSNGDMILDL